MYSLRVVPRSPSPLHVRARRALSSAAGRRGALPPTTPTASSWRSSPGARPRGRLGLHRRQHGPPPRRRRRPPHPRPPPRPLIQAQLPEVRSAPPPTARASSLAPETACRSWTPTAAPSLTSPTSAACPGSFKVEFIYK